MSYSITLWCGCRIYVACHPRTSAPHTRIVERRDLQCQDRRHDVGARIRLWEMLPDPRATEPRIEYEAR
jgi:hypothetical protein